MLTLFLTVAVAAPALKEKPRAQPSIVGVWVVESTVVGGQPHAADATPEHWTFNADGTRTAGPAGGPLRTGTYTLDPKAGPPALNMSAGQISTYQCIYKVEGDTLTLNIGWQKADRPAEFASPAGSQCTLKVFKRVKPDREKP